MTTPQFFNALMDWLLADPAHVVAAASALAAIVPTPEADSWQFKLYKIVDVLALNFCRAKETGAPSAQPPSPPPMRPTGGAAAIVIAAMLGTALSACTNLNDPTTVIVSVETSYGAALAAENEYLASGKADPKVVSTLTNARKGVAQVLDPIAETAAKGQPPTSDQALAAQVALSAFQAALQDNGLLPKASNGSF